LYVIIISIIIVFIMKSVFVIFLFFNSCWG
jgi:hypothetical protein